MKQTRKKILIEVAKILSKFSLNYSSPEMARVIYKLVREKIHLEDPFKNIKIESNKIALGIYDKLKESSGICLEAVDPNDFLYETHGTIVCLRRRN